jgi:hypothetical protein
MKLTNRFNLPEPLVHAVSTDDYLRGGRRLYVHELIRPGRIQSDISFWFAVSSPLLGVLLGLLTAAIFYR